MALFSSNHVFNGTKLRRNRSLSKEPPSSKGKPSEDTSSRKRAQSVLPAPTPRRMESLNAPNPLPAAVPTGVLSAGDPTYAGPVPRVPSSRHTSTPNLSTKLTTVRANVDNNVAISPSLPLSSPFGSKRRKNSIGGFFDLFCSPAPTFNVPIADDLPVLDKRFGGDTSLYSPFEASFDAYGKPVAVESLDYLKTPQALGWRKSHEKDGEDRGRRMAMGQVSNRKLPEQKVPEDSNLDNSMLSIAQEKENVRHTRQTLRKESQVPCSPRVGLNSKHSIENESKEEGGVWEESVDKVVYHITRGKEYSESSGSSKVWNLVRRLSNGNLKDKNVSTPETPPLVPPLPGEQSPPTTPPKIGEMPTSPTVVAEAPGGMMRHIRNMSPARASKQTNANRRVNRISGSPNSSASDSSPNVGLNSGRKRSNPTRSDNFKSSLHLRTSSLSQTSSRSSHDESLPPLPKTHDIHLPIPLPASDPHTVSKHFASFLSSDNASPTIPAFEVRNAFNKFDTHEENPVQDAPPKHAHFPDTEPFVARRKIQSVLSRIPSIPSRKARRPTSLSVVPHRASGQKSDVNVLTRRSSAKASEPTTRPRSPVEGQPTSPIRSPLMFREMTNKEQPLTEDEKNAKWEDLLQRSDMAGGTLHMGPQTTDGLALWSDRVSLAPSETLDQIS